MQEAINQAKIALSCNEVPVGVIITDGNGNIIALAHNMIEKYQNPLMHAECIAIFRACKKLKSRSLMSCNLYTTLEPCYMCAGAIANAKITRVYIGTEDERFGAIINGAKIYQNKFVNHIPEVYSGIMENECKDLLQNFFKNLRC